MLESNVHSWGYDMLDDPDGCGYRLRCATGRGHNMFANPFSVSNLNSFNTYLVIHVLVSMKIDCSGVTLVIHAVISPS